MMLWPNGRPKQWFGFTDMGPIELPPNPVYITMIDRDTGAEWWLTYSLTPPADDGYGYISITDTAPPAGWPTTRFGPYDGPYLGVAREHPAKLMIRNGYLGVEEDQPGYPITDAESMQVYARIASLNAPMRHIILSRNTLPDAIGGWYAFVPYTFVQTPNP